MSFLSDQHITCPANLLAMAKSLPPVRVAIAAAEGELPMHAALQATRENIMTPVFTGDEALIREQARALDWDISGFPLIAASGETEAAQTAAALCGAGKADVLMKGHLHTDVFMKSILNRQNGLRMENRLVHLFHMSLPESDDPLILSDCAVNVSPDFATKKAALSYCVEMLQIVGASHPKIAILSATETPVTSVPSSVEAADLASWAQEQHLPAEVRGPLALDLVLSLKSASIKGLVGDPVAGKANGVIVPDLVSGNILFKSLVYLRGACAAGIVMGARVPVLLTSRADPPAARLASVALAAIMANGHKKSMTRQTNSIIRI